MGLYTDSNKINQPEGKWRDARNILISDVAGVITPEKGSEDFGSFPDDFTLLHTQPLNDGRILLIGEDSNNVSTIALMNDTGSFFKVICDNVLNFPLNGVYSSDYELNNKKETIVGITDNVNPPLLINIDDVPVELNLDKSLVDPTEINKLYLFPESDPPKIESTIITGGGINTGSIFALFKYVNDDGTETNYHNVIGPDYIVANSSNQIDEIDGSEPNVNSNKAIRYNLSGVDQRFDKLNLSILSVREGITRVESVKEIEITSSNLEIIYNGTETTEELTLEEVLTKVPLYVKAKVLRAHQDSLYLANLTKDEELDLQGHANKIKINFNSTNLDLNNTGSKKNHKTGFDGGFMYGEVYAMYAYYLLNNGETTRAFHIPGRTSVANDLVNSSKVSGYKKYQVEDTCNVSSPSYTIDVENGLTVTRVSNSDQGNTRSNMGFWENENETYPSDFPDFPDENVRHHRFPSLNYVRENIYGGAFGVNVMPALGIDVTMTEEIPSNLRDRVKAIVIGYAKPSVENTTVLGFDHVHYGAKTNNPAIDTNVVWSSGGNFTSFTETSDNSWYPFNSLDLSTLRCSCFDLLRNKPSISPTYIKTEYNITKTGVQDLYNDVGKDGVEYLRTGQGLTFNTGVGIETIDSRLSCGIFDYTSLASTISSDNEVYKLITDYKYIPQDTIVDNVYNLECNETLFFQLDSNLTGYQFNGLLEVNSLNTNVDSNLFRYDGAGAAEYNDAIYGIYQAKKDIYLTYQNQDIITTNKIITDLDSDHTEKSIYGGDCFSGLHTYISKAKNQANVNAGYGKNTGAFFFYAFYIPCRNNAGFRHEIGDTSTKYYPKSSIGSFFININEQDQDEFITNLAAGNIINNFQYNDDYSKLNEFNNPAIDFGDQNDVTEFPYRVIRGGRKTDNINSTSWRTFLPNDYYEANSKRGEVMNLESMDDILLIHHKYGLFRTVGNESFKTSTIEVTLGKQDIFALEPKEPIINEEGYLGIQDVGSAKMCKAGYFWVDTEAKKIFLLKPDFTVKEISNTGIRNDLRKKINTSNFKNILEGFGFTVCFDDFYNRIILRHKSNLPSKGEDFTLSFDIGKEEWICYHDYFPTLLFNTRNNVYSWKEGNRLQKHNTGKLGEFYGTIYPSTVEYILNPDQSNDKIFKSILMITERRNYITDELVRNKTVDALKIECSYIDLPKKDIIIKSSSNPKFNTRRLKNTWSFNDIRESNSNILKRRRLIDKYLSVKIFINNTENLDNSQDIIYLYNIAAQTEIVNR